MDKFPVRGDGQYPIAQKYLATRAHYPTVPAQRVLAAIRGELRGIKTHHFEPERAYNPRITRKVGYSRKAVITEERWITSTQRAGLRFVGYADELVGRGVWPGVGIDHQGWYLDGECPDSSEVYRGAVWQLPSRGGRAVYVAGYCDPFNDGAALIDFSPIYGEPGGSNGYSREDAEQAARDAAFAANSMAQRDAETEQVWRAKSSARLRVDSLREDICQYRARHCALIRAIWTGAGDNAVGARMRADVRANVGKLVRELRVTVNEYGDEILTEEYA